MSRLPEPTDLYRFRIPTDPHLSPDGATVAFTLQTVAPSFDGYRHAIWWAPVDGSSEPRQATIGARHDTLPRYSPDGRALAFLSDRRLTVEEDPEAPTSPKEREDGTQIHVLPLDGGEARRVSSLPRGVDGFEWSPDGRRFVAVSASVGATREDDARRRGTDGKRRPTEPPVSDYHYLDRLQYVSNGAGFVYHRRPRLWLVDLDTGEARRLTDGRVPEGQPAWSPDGSRIAFAADRRSDRDIRWRSDVWVIDVASGRVTKVTGGNGMFGYPAWLPDGRTLAVLGHRFPAGAGSRNDLWLFAADGSEAGVGGGRNLTSRHDLMIASAMNSDVVPHEEPRIVVADGGESLLVTAPVEGSYELWRIGVVDGGLTRLTDGRHYLSAFDAVPVAEGTRIAAIRSSATDLPDVHVLDLPAAGRARRPRTAGGQGSGLRRVTAMNEEALRDVVLGEPEERRWTVDGREIQGWYVAPPPGTETTRAPTSAPVVTEIHGGPQTLYGWSPVWEFQVLAAAGIGVFYSNPRGSEGYGQDFAAANFRDWGPGPTRDVLAGIDGLVADGLADPGRLGLTGGSYGGYLTNWIIGHDDRFRAALTARSVSDMAALMVTGDLAGGEFGRLEFGSVPWEDPEFYREASPLTYAERIHTPLLIQHAENDLRCPVGQAEALFAILRTLKRPVRFMRVPEESHELTRSGTPFRRVENLVQVRDWFRHFLVDGKRGLPPLPRARAGK